MHTRDSAVTRGRSKAGIWAAALMLGAAMGVSSTGGWLPGIPAAEAQNFGQRSIFGKVVDDTGTPKAGATVFLKNMKTKDVKSFASQQDGAFRFAQVGMADDYEVWAELGKIKSNVRTISSFDSRKEVEFDLKLK